MKLINHVLKIRSLVQQAIDNRFAKMGIKETGLVPVESLPQDLIPKRKKLEDILNNHLTELQDYSKARQETISECTFTLFNKIAAIKVMEEKELFPEVIKRRPENGNKSFAHNLWLEENPGEKSAERQGLKHFLQSKFNELGENFSLYNENYPYSLMPTADELYNILEAFNEVEEDPDCGNDIWKGDDILGWVYENFNSTEKAILKESGEKTEYDKVSLQSQVYTPQWVVKFLVDNSLGKMYLEMFPDSDLVKPNENGEVKYKIANAPTTRRRDVKKMEEIRVIDPACGSGNFLIYTFDLLYDMYVNQVEQYGADYSRRDIPRLILENNIYGVDLDERAVQLSQIALFIKAKERGGRRAKIPSHTNVVSTHFFLPDYSEVESEFVSSGEWDAKQRETIKKIWSDLQNAFKFGTLVRVEEVLNGLSLKEDEGLLFAEEMSENLFSFKRRVTEVLRDQVKAYCEKNASEYALTKAEDAMTFLSILSMPFDVVVANPPYTDSADYGEELRCFIEENYKKPWKFNTNLYASFIKRCCELAGANGKVGMVNPPTFMYIKTFEDVRKYLIEKTHINLFVEWGYLGMFSSFARVDSAMFTLELGNKDTVSTFIKLNDLYEMKRKPVLFKAYADYCDGVENDRVFVINQAILKDIKSYPFIYWISDRFRANFKSLDLDSSLAAKQGLATSDNNRFLRFWWEVQPETISREVGDKKKWVFYAKGGPYNKWYGNLWTIVNWDNDGEEIRNTRDENGRQRSRTQNEEFYFKEGITYTLSGSKGATFRLLPPNCIFDVAGSCLFTTSKFSDLYYALGFLNTPFCFYILDCLNPTVSTQIGDLKRIPFTIPSKDLRSMVALLAKYNVDTKKHICDYSLIEPSYKGSPITPSGDIDGCIKRFFIYENALMTIILLNESLITANIFDIYALSEHDKKLVLDSQGVPVGSLPVSIEAKEFFLGLIDEYNITVNDGLKEYVEALPISDASEKIEDFYSLYMSNNGWEEFCSRHNVNPINALYQFYLTSDLPSQRSYFLVLELIASSIKELLDTDDDGIIPLVDKIGEEKLSLRLEQYLSEKGFSALEINQLLHPKGFTIEKYLQDCFFGELSDYLNLYQHLPKAPFIWHISSGPEHAIELYVSIYKWSRNSLFRIKSVYAANRESSLKDRLTSLNLENPMEQMEANRISAQLKEIKAFVAKIDALLADGYDPIIDDGVAKNIAPLQAKGLLSYDVLNASQLKKYLSVDW